MNEPLSNRDFLAVYWRFINGARRHPVAVDRAIRFFFDLQRRDPNLFSTIRRIFEGDQEAVRLFQAQFGSIELENQARMARRSLKGVAEELTQRSEVLAQLAAIPHLGALENISLVTATRQDYALLLGQAVLDIKDAYPGMGLSRTRIVGNRKVTGLEIAQSWALLLNAGHLFGTFATERAIIYHLHQDPQARRQVLAAVPTPLRSAVEGVINTRSLYNFFEVLAAMRLSTWKDDKARALATNLLVEFFQSRAARDQTDAVLWTFRKARQLAYARLHGFMGIGVNLPANRYEPLLRMLRRWPDIAWSGAAEVPGPAVQMLDTIDAFEDEAMFASPEAARAVLGHLREFRRWWSAQPIAANTVDRISRLFERPQGWTAHPTQPLEHFTRLHLGQERAWVDEVVDWLGDENGTRWHGGNFVVTPEHGQAALVVDVYTEGEALPPHIAWMTTSQLARNCRLAKDDPYLQASGGVFVVKLLRQVFAPEYRLSLQPLEVAQDANVVAIGSRREVVERLRHCAQNCNDGERRLELGAIQRYLEDRADDDAVWSAILGKVRLHAMDTGQEVGEIDGVLAQVRETGIVWTLIERKDARSGTGRKQLDALRTRLHTPCAEPKVDSTDPGTMFIQVTWPAPIG